MKLSRFIVLMPFLFVSASMADEMTTAAPSSPPAVSSSKFVDAGGNLRLAPNKTTTPQSMSPSTAQPVPSHEQRVEPQVVEPSNTTVVPGTMPAVSPTMQQTVPMSATPPVQETVKTNPPNANNMNMPNQSTTTTVPVTPTVQQGT